MAKTRQEIENRMPTTVITFKPKHPAPTFARCGCGKPALYEVYEHQEPHCQTCFDDALDNKCLILARRIQGGYDDAG